jgi:hypothetical protein
MQRPWPEQLRGTHTFWLQSTPPQDLSQAQRPESHTPWPEQSLGQAESRQSGGKKPSLQKQRPFTQRPLPAQVLPVPPVGHTWVVQLTPAQPSTQRQRPMRDTVSGTQLPCTQPSTQLMMLQSSPSKPSLQLQAKLPLALFRSQSPLPLHTALELLGQADSSQLSPVKPGSQAQTRGVSAPPVALKEHSPLPLQNLAPAQVAQRSPLKPAAQWHMTPRLSRRSSQVPCPLQPLPQKEVAHSRPLQPLLHLHTGFPVVEVRHSPWPWQRGRPGQVALEQSAPFHPEAQTHSSDTHFPCPRSALQFLGQVLWLQSRPVKDGKQKHAPFTQAPFEEQSAGQDFFWQ